MMKIDTAVIIVAILLVASLAFVFTTELKLNMENDYVSINTPYNPPRGFYGEPKEIPFIVDAVEDYTEWELYVTIRSPGFKRSEFTYEGGFLDAGPYYVTVDFGGTWDETGIWEIKIVELSASATPGGSMELIDFENDNCEFIVKHFPATTTIFEVTPESVMSGDTISIDYSIINDASVYYDMCYRIFADEDHNGVFNTGEKMYTDACDSNFLSGEEHSGTIEKIAEWEHSIEGDLWITLEIYSYGTKIHETWEYEMTDIYVGEPIHMYSLTLSTIPYDQVLLVEPMEDNYEEGELVKITALIDMSTDDYWNFESWSGDVTGDESNPITIVMNKDKTIIANYFWDEIGHLTDTDGDGVPDHLDQCPGHDDNIDLNGNGIPDGCDDGDPIPGFEIFIFICAFTLIVLKFKKEKLI